MRTQIYTAFGHRFYDLSAFVRARPRPIYEADAMNGCTPIRNENRRRWRLEIMYPLLGMSIIQEELVAKVDYRMASRT